MNVISAQKEAIENLKLTISSFVSRRTETRVASLAIPTGWGKTRIAIQAILQADYRKKAPASIIIWPQKTSHMSKEVWKRCSDWCKKPCGDISDKKCKNNKIHEIKYLNPSKRGPKEGRHEQGSLSHSKKFKGTFYYVNNRFKQGVISDLKYSNGPIIFIIDEWHSKKFLEKYQNLPNNNEHKNAGNFWRNELLGETKTSRQLFVILISATPIGATSQMDEIGSDDTEDKFEKNLKESLSAFKDLTKVGKQQREYALHKIYPQIIIDEEKRLKKFHDEHKYKIKTKAQDWIKEYICLSQQAYKNFDKKPNPPSLIYAFESLLTSGGSEEIASGVSEEIGKKHYKSLKKYFKKGFLHRKTGLKQSVILELLKKYKDKKFVVFCHYIAVAEALDKFLRKNKIDSCYLSGEVKGTKFDDFNDELGKTRVLIVTDKHSQGVSLHKSEAWLIHFELSWNPVRIIQRYGRVWRINTKRKKITDTSRKIITKPMAFYIPHSFSSEEEMIRRLKNRWKVLHEVSCSKNSNFINLAPISFEIALGQRCTPNISRLKTYDSAN